jgi:hypothetical protein
VNPWSRVRFPGDAPCSAQIARNPQSARSAGGRCDNTPRDFDDGPAGVGAALIRRSSVVRFHGRRLPGRRRGRVRGQDRAVDGRLEGVTEQRQRGAWAVTCIRRR